jgi:hypothetical protein
LNMTITIDSTGNGGSRPFTLVCSALLVGTFILLFAIGTAINYFLVFDFYWAWAKLILGGATGLGRIATRPGQTIESCCSCPAVPRLASRTRGARRIRLDLARFETPRPWGVYWEGITCGWQSPFCKLDGFSALAIFGESGGVRKLDCFDYIGR